MPRRTSAVLLTLALALFLAGCDLIGGIFKVGFGVGLLIAAVVVALLLMLFRGRKRGAP